MTARGHLTALPSPADERRAWNRRAAALELPATIAGSSITWGPWAPPLRITHIPLDCTYCDAAAKDAARACGNVSYQRRGKPPRQLRRFFAYGCLACGALDVFDWYPDGPGQLRMSDFVEAWTNRPDDNPGVQGELFSELTP